MWLTVVSHDLCRVTPGKTRGFGMCVSGGGGRVAGNNQCYKQTQGIKVRHYVSTAYTIQINSIRVW